MAVTPFERVLPRHLQIVYEINRCRLDEVTTRPGDVERVRAHVAIEEGIPNNTCAWPTWPSSAAIPSTG